LFEKPASRKGYPVQRRRVLALKMDPDRTCRPADSAEQIAFRRKRTRVRQPDNDLLANDSFELANAGLVLHTGSDSSSARPSQDVPVLELRLLLSLHVRAHALEDRRQQLSIDRLRAHARGEVEEGVNCRALDRR